VIKSTNVARLDSRWNNENLDAPLTIGLRVTVVVAVTVVAVAVEVVTVVVTVLLVTVVVVVVHTSTRPPMYVPTGISKS